MRRIFILALLSFCLIQFGHSQTTNVIDPELYSLMNSRSADKISINIILKKRLDASEVAIRKNITSYEAKRAYMVKELKYIAAKDQFDLLEMLQAGERSSQISDISTHWLVNMINCTASADAIYRIAEHPDVEAVIYNKKEYLLFNEKASPASPVRGTTANVTQIQADKVWELGYTGKGIIVAVIDTGVNTSHVDLKDHLWSDADGYHGMNTLDNNYDITDNNGHGTHCAGTICGDGTSGTATGVAPDATLMCIKALGDDGEGSLEAMVDAVEYATDNGAHVLSLSLGFSYPGAYVNEIMRELFSNNLAAGVVASVAAGNDGRTDDMLQYPIPRNINAPGACPPPWLHPDQQSEPGGLTNVICIGAVNYSDGACDFSSEGPVSWENTSYGDYKYGTGIPTKTLNYDDGSVGSYYTFGNSFAVMFPSDMLTGFGSGGKLSAITIFDGASTTGTFQILKGGSTPTAGTQVHSQTFTLNASGDMVDIDLNTDLTVDASQSLWIVVTLDANMIPIAQNEGNDNGCWVKDGSTWTNSYVKKMLALRAKVTTSNTSETHNGLIRPDVTAPGYQIQSASHTSINGFATMSGTSMATPCAAGAMALLLDANENLSPADICQVLEETSVKLTTNKSNKTGTGRINIYDAVLQVIDLELTAPTLTATATSSSTIDLQWNSVLGGESYTVYRNGTEIANNITGTTYSDTGLSSETEYCYQVKVVKGTESETSAEACATTLGDLSGQQYRIIVSTASHGYYGYCLNINSFTLPSTNTTCFNVVSKAQSNSQIFTLEDAGNGNYYIKNADGYYIKCGDSYINSGKDWCVYAYSTTEKTPLTLQYVDDKNFYIRDYDKTTGANHSSAKPDNNYFKVEGGSIYCDAPISNTDVVTWTFELVEPEKPEAPTNLTAKAQDTNTINLSWSTVSGATSYTVYRDGALLANNVTGTTYSDTGLTASTQYCYTVTAVNAVGESEKSNEACATTKSEGGGSSGGEAEIGFDSGVSSGYLPISTMYKYSCSQQIYTPEEIVDKDSGDPLSGNITKITFKQQNAQTPTRKIKVYMQNTTKLNFATTKIYTMITSTDWVNLTDNDKVFEGEVPLLGSDSELTITLDTPFEYTGENLLIAVYDNTGEWFSSGANFYIYNTESSDGNRSIYTCDDAAAYNPGSMNGNVTGRALNTPANNSIKITFESTTPPIPSPKNVKATPESIFYDQSTTISWDACDGAASYNVYVDGVKHNTSAITSTSYVLSNLQYNMDPGVQVNVTAIVDGAESDKSDNVFVKVAGYFPLVINVVDTQGNPIQGANVVLTGYGELGDEENRTFTSDANGKISVEMPIPLLNNCYNLEATKSVLKGSNIVCDFNSDPPYDVENGVEYVVEIVMELPTPLSLYSDKDSYEVGEDIILIWDPVTDATPLGYNLYEKYWDEASSSYIYEKINATLISPDLSTYTVVGGLPTRGCTNTICLTAVYDEGETGKGHPSVTVAKTGRGVMAGLAVDENGNPLSGVTVVVSGTDCQGNVSFEETYVTGTDGTFGEEMPMGIYTISVSKPGYLDRSISDIEINHGEETEVIVELWLPGDEYELEKIVGGTPSLPYFVINAPVLPVTVADIYSGSQQIYTKEELDFASASDVKITSISFRVDGNSNSSKVDYIRIFMQNTEKEQFSGSGDWVTFSDTDKVFDGTYVIPSDGEWATLDFTTPFVYTGGNILVTAYRAYTNLTPSGFYVYETENVRSLCSGSDTYDPIYNYSNGTMLYKNNTIKIKYTSTSPDVLVTPNPIDFGEVIVGDYWTEKPSATVPVQIKAFNTKLNSVTVDNPFFVLPTLDLTQTVLDFGLGYNVNNAPGYKAGTLTVLPKKGIERNVNITATAYEPVEPDIIEKAREVVWVNHEYEDTPDYTTLHDDYVLPSETTDGTRNEAVYKFTLDRGAYITAKIYNGTKAILAFYREDFSNDDVDKDGPSADNPYYGVGDEPIANPIDICILGDDCDGTLPDWTFKDKDGDGRGFGLAESSGWGGESNANVGDWALISKTTDEDYNKIKPENYVYTTEKYRITEMSEITFSHIHADCAFSSWHEIFDVVISEDGETFTTVKHIEYTTQSGEDRWFHEAISLADHSGKEVHIGFMHKDDRDNVSVTGIKIDNVCINGVLETTTSGTGSGTNSASVRASGRVTAVIENLEFPKGTYYVVPAAESDFTFYITKQDIEEDEIIFTGVGDWKVPGNWNINAVPQPTDDVIIRGNAEVSDAVNIKSILIEDVATLTILQNGVLKVTEGIENDLHSAFIMKDGAQLYQNADDVAATFNMNINNPASWGPDGSHHSQGWQFIASPFVDADLLGYVRPDDGDYDLYKYDGTQHLEWVNYKLHHDEFSYDFADGMQGWTVVDANGDGFSWSYSGGTGNDGVAGYLSCVFNQGNSDDYLVSPKIINTYPESKLRFWVKNASNVTTTTELEVWLSGDKAAAPSVASDFVTKVKTVEVTNTWQQVEILLEAYADQDDRDFMEYWYAIRSLANDSDNTEILIDKIELANYEEPNPYETEFVLGRGYMASYEKDSEATLQGILNHETEFDYDVKYNADDRWENFYLIGNPFTFNINWTDFTHSNIVDGFAVVDDDGSYQYDVNADIKVGDAIMVMTTGANPTISVSKTTRRNKVADYLNVVASGADGDDNFIVTLSGDENEGFKKLENFNKDIANIYVSEYGTQYGIVNRDEDVEEVEFSFFAKKIGYYTIDVEVNGKFSSVKLYDRVENVETDMLTANGYKFFALDTKDNHDRFVLRFAKKTTSEGGDFVYQSGDELVIDAEGLVEIIDVMGRVVYSGEQSGINRVNINGMENSACVVRNINNNEIRTQKIVIL